MNISVAGGSGFIGEALVRALLIKGHEVSVLTRSPSKVRAGRPVPWDAKSQGAWSVEVASADVVINLAGESIGGGRWTEARKRRLIESRIDSTRAIVEAMRSAPQNRRTLINASAVGYYGLRGDEELDENGSRGMGFLADLSARWEEEARAAETIARTVILRFGVVLGDGGGVLERMLLPFRLGLGGRIGSGNQWMSWVSRDDVVRMIEWAIARDDVRGVYNATAPQPVRNREFTRALARALKRPAFLPLPAFALKAALGKMADELLLHGQRVVPRRALDSGFRFEQHTIDAALQRALRVG